MRLLKLRREEAATALLMILYFFLAMASVSVVKSLQNALYLAQVGFDWRLPALYVVLALVSGVGVAFYRGLARRFTRVAINVSTLMALIGTLLAFYFLIQKEVAWIYPVFYVWGGVFSILVPTQGWLLSYELYTTREAKRIFSLLGTGGILGGAGGGFYAALMGDVGDTGLLLPQVAVILLMMQALLLILARRIGADGQASGRPAATGRDDDKSTSASSLRSLLRSPYLSTLAGLVMMSACATTLIDLQYKWVLEDRYAGSPGAITEFFGILLGVTFLFSALFQLFGTSRLLRSLGVGTGLLAMPVALMAGSVPTMIWAGFASVVLVKVIDGCLRTSVHKTSVELIYLPVSSPETATVKGFIELVVFRCGDALGAALFVAASSLSSGAVGAVGAVVLLASGLWTFLSWKLGREYAKTLRGTLQKRTGSVFRQALQSREAVAEKTLLDALKSSSVSKVHLALQLLIDNLSDGGPEGYPVADESGELVFHGVTAGQGSTPDWLDKVEPLLEHPNSELAAAALHLLILHRPEVHLQNLQRNCGGDALPGLLCLHYLERYVENPRSLLRGERLLTWSRGAAGRQARILIRLMARVGNPAFLPVLRVWAGDNDHALARTAIKALGVYRDREDVDRLVGLLGRPRCRRAASQALGAFGNEVVDRLSTLLRDHDADLAVRREIPGILARIGTAPAQNALVSALYLHDPVVSFRALKGLNKVRTRRGLPFGEVVFSPVLQIWVREHYELLNLDLLTGRPQSRCERLLKKAVRERLDWGTEKIFRGLELFLPPGDAYFSYLAFTGNEPGLRENAIELIDLRIKGELRQTILPIITGHSQREVVEIGRRLYRLSGDLAKVMSDALFLADPWLKCCIIAAIKARGQERLRGRVGQASQDTHPVVRETAAWAIETWASP